MEACSAKRHHSKSKLNMARGATIHRKTNETDVRLKLNLDGRGKARITTGIRFFDHMMDLVARHGAFDLQLKASGDLDVDQHHTVADVGITLAQAASGKVHLRVLYGRSSHHQVEAMFKAFARALRFAVSRDKRLRNILPSTKGLL